MSTLTIKQSVNHLVDGDQVTDRYGDVWRWTEAGGFEYTHDITAADAEWLYGNQVMQALEGSTLYERPAETREELAKLLDQLGGGAGAKRCYERAARIVRAGKIVA